MRLSEAVVLDRGPRTRFLVRTVVGLGSLVMCFLGLGFRGMRILRPRVRCRFARLFGIVSLVLNWKFLLELLTDLAQVVGTACPVWSESLQVARFFDCAGVDGGGCSAAWGVYSSSVEIHFELLLLAGSAKCGHGSSSCKSQKLVPQWGR